MKQLWWRLNRLFHPHKIIVLSSIPLTVILMAYIFLGEHKNDGIAYPSYLISAYSLIIVCLMIWKYSKTKIMILTSKNQHIQRYMSDLTFRSHISLVRSFALNIFYVTLHLCAGIYDKSLWSVTLAVYYCLLAVMRFLLLRHAKRFTLDKNFIFEFKLYRLCGSILLLMNIALSGVITLVIHQDEGFHYTGMFIYLMATYAFYSIIIAVINIMKYRKLGSPIIWASKVINFVVALVAMFSLETAMLSRFDTNNTLLFQKMIIGMTGTMICTIVFGIAIFMLAYATVKLKEKEMQNACR